MTELVDVLTCFVDQEGEKGNIVNFLSGLDQKVHAAFNLMTYAGKIASVKTLRILLQNKDVLMCLFPKFDFTALALTCAGM